MTDRQTAKGRREGVVLFKTVHTRQPTILLGNVEMVKEIGMRVGGPSKSQVRRMRSAGEMGGVGQRKETAHTFNKHKKKRIDKRHAGKREGEMRAQKAS